MWFLVISLLLFLTLCWLQAQWKNDPSSTITHPIALALHIRASPGRARESASSSHLWCIKVCRKFKAPFHLLSLWNASSLDYKWQPHLHVKAEETREITCPVWAVPEQEKCPLWQLQSRQEAQTRASAWNPNHLWSGAHGTQGTDSSELLSATSPTLWKDFLPGEAGLCLLVVNMHSPRFCFQAIYICIVPVTKVINEAS